MYPSKPIECRYIQGTETHRVKATTRPMVQGGFLTGPAPKVLSIGCFWVCQRKCEILTQTFTFLVGILQSPTLQLLGRNQSKNHPVYQVEYNTYVNNNQKFPY